MYLLDSNNNIVEDNLSKSCVEENLAGLTEAQITLKLDSPYLVDAILIVGGWNTFISNYRLYVGMDPDYNNN